MRLKLLRGFLAIGGLMFAAQGAQSENESAQLLITGTVAAFAQVFLESVTGNTGLNLATVFPAQQIAVLRERSNRRTGYKVTVSSANLQHAGRCPVSTKACFYSSTAGEGLALDLFKGDTVVAMSGTPAAGNWTLSNLKTTGPGVSNAVKVAFDGSAASLAAASDYTETLTFTITANP